MTPATQSPALVAVGLLGLGAVLELLLVGVISGPRGERSTTTAGPRPLLATVLGLPFAVAAIVVGLSADNPVGLAVAALSAVACVALLLLPVLEAEVPAQVGEAAALLLLGTAGAVALAGALDLLQAVVGLETLALSAVILVTLGRGERPLEAAFKYFVLGAISLAGLLYGLGLIYLGTGSFAFPSAAEVGGSSLVLAGTALVVMGFGFELAVFPFHWGPLDAYTAAAPPLAGFIMSASKLAAAYALGRLALAAGLPVGQVLVWVGCVTIIWGTFGALAQPDNLRRMLGYSAVTHAGFIALALGSGSGGPTVAIFYAAIYGSMAMLVFASLAGAGPDLSRMGAFRAAALALGLFSLSGIPPTPGFWAKLAVLVVAWQAVGPLPTLIAVAGGVFSVLYYLRPLPEMFAAMRGVAAAEARRPVIVPALVVATVAVVALGLFPGLVWALARPS